MALYVVPSLDHGRNIDASHHVEHETTIPPSPPPTASRCFSEPL
jgi:hypothetical protein